MNLARFRDWRNFKGRDFEIGGILSDGILRTVEFCDWRDFERQVFEIGMILSGGILRLAEFENGGILSGVILRAEI